MRSMKRIVHPLVRDVRGGHAPRYYPSQRGWDQYFGYGRGNAKAAA